MNNTDSMATLPATPPRRHWGRVVFLLILLAITLPVAAWAGIHGVQRSKAQRGLDDAVAEVTSNHPKWRLKDLEAERKPVPDDQNAALVVLEAKALLPKDAQFASPVIRPERQLTPAQLELVRTQLQPAEKALAKADGLAKFATGRFPESEKKGPLAPSKGCEDAVKVASMLRLHAMLRSQDNDMDGAMRAALNIAGAARAVGDEPHLVAQLARNGCRSELRSCLERVLAQGQPPETLLSQMQKALEKEAEVPSGLLAARGELARHHEAATAAEAGDADLDKILLQVTDRGNPGREYVLGPWPGTVARKAHVHVLHLLTGLVDVCRLPDEEQGAAARELLENLDLVIDGYMLFPDLDKRISGLPTTFRRNDATLRCCIVAVAVERFRQANKRWPKKLDELVPAQLVSIPVDPFGGGPIHLEQRKNGVSIYSIGRDPPPESEEQPRRRSTDTAKIEFRLFDPAQRRQPGSDVEEPDPLERMRGQPPGGSGEKQSGSSKKS